MKNAYACTGTIAPVVTFLIGSASVEAGCLWLRLVLNEERLNPANMAPLADSISNRRR